MTSTFLVDDLRRQLVLGQALVIAGAGVSSGATGDAATSTWMGLLEDGIDRVVALRRPGLPDAWDDVTRRQLAACDLEWTLAVAEDVTQRLGGKNSGEFRSWLKDAIGSLTVSDPRVIQALLELGAPIATTNYDSLIEDVGDRPCVTWRDGGRIERMMRGDEAAVLHLHGYWDDPQSVVVGVRSYAAVLGSAPAQALLRAMAAVNSIVFVGFGEGMADPNFRAFRAWLKEALSGSEYRHFRLCTESEHEAVAREHDADERILPVVYGTRHDQLASFLGELTPTATDRRAVSASAKAAPRLSSEGRVPASRFCVGRETLVDQVATAMVSDGQPTIVLGTPGIGKSTVCRAALHDRRVETRFGDRRWLVRCEAVRTATELLAALANQLGVTMAHRSGSLLDDVRAELGREPALVVLDNLETPWGHDGPDTEELLGHLASEPRLAMVAAVRGLAKPGGVHWSPPFTVAPLDRPHSRTLFLAITGERYGDDPLLDSLLEQLDGVPLAIELLAHAAQGEPNLGGLAARWETERVQLLQRHGGSDRQLSVAASLEVSLTSPLMRPQGRSLLPTLGYLPDGIAHTDLEALLGDAAKAGAGNLRQLGLAFDQGGRLRTLAPIREHLSADYPPPRQLRAHIDNHYICLARTEGARLRRPGGAVAARRLAAETGNLSRILDGDVVDRPDSDREALTTVLEYLTVTGYEFRARQRLYRHGTALSRGPNQDTTDYALRYLRVDRRDEVDIATGIFGSTRRLRVRNVTDRPVDRIRHVEYGDTAIGHDALGLVGRSISLDADLEFLSRGDPAPAYSRDFEILLPTSLPPGGETEVQYYLAWHGEASDYGSQPHSQSVSLVRYRQGVESLAFGVSVRAPSDDRMSRAWAASVSDGYFEQDVIDDAVLPRDGERLQCACEILDPSAAVYVLYYFIESPGGSVP